jgi:colanic acid biosynthesis protein WcaH
VNITEAIAILDKKITNPRVGLPDEVFYFISRITPLINVDLLVKDEKGRTLLAWRDDEYTGTGWHVPGGIVRFKETLETRIKKVAELEIGAEVQFEPAPIAVNEIINKEKDIRGHFISILYKCSLSSSFVPKNKGLTEKDPGFLKWHEACPDNLLKFHEIYKKYL